MRTVGAEAQRRKEEFCVLVCHQLSHISICRGKITVKVEPIPN